MDNGGPKDHLTTWPTDLFRGGPEWIAGGRTRAFRRPPRPGRAICYHINPATGEVAGTVAPLPYQARRAAYLGRTTS